jgi:hypothetical protein
MAHYELVTWRALIDEEMQKHGDAWPAVTGINPSDLDLDRKFDDGFGAAEGVPFILWTYTRVYFPVVYDGAESVGSVPAKPDASENPEHFGGQ